MRNAVLIKRHIPNRMTSIAFTKLAEADKTAIRANHNGNYLLAQKMYQVLVESVEWW